MHENEFEKRVREKMDQLSFDPSDTVWSGVDKEINRKEKRRRPLFWVFFLSGLTLAAGSFYYYSRLGDSHIAPATKRQPATEHPSILHPEDIGDTSEKESLSIPASGQTVQHTNQTFNRMSPGNANHPRSGKPGQTSDGVVLPPSSDRTIPEQAETGQEVLIAGRNLVADSSNGLKSVPLAGTKPALDSDSLNKKAKEELKKGKPSIWHLGFTAGLGVSNITPGLFKSANQYSPGYFASAPANVNGGPATVNQASAINSGFSFGIGAFVSRSLSKRVAISVGVNYQYYSTVIRTGRSDSLTASSPGAALYSSLNGVYAHGNGYAYTNQYHFLELPLAVNFQLNKNVKTPLILEQGVSVSYLLSSNALYYDSRANLYYKDIQLLNKTQLNTSTAVMVGFRMRTNELLLGPQFLYGLTSLLKNSAGSPEHLIYWGLKFAFVPLKN
jgi:Outer membrane protein beta-barrel domain